MSKNNNKTKFTHVFYGTQNKAFVKHMYRLLGEKSDAVRTKMGQSLGKGRAAG